MGGDRGGAALSKLRLLGVVGAKLRAEVLPGGRAPDFNVAIAGTERFAAEHAQRGLPFMRYLLLVSIGISPAIWRISIVRPDSLMPD